ncbi:MAG: hypothetical protein WAS54_10820 [Scrofimicrobium sp.]
MASFVKLTTDWDSSSQSYLDNFSNYVLGAMVDHHLQQATPEEMAAAVADTYGLEFPVAVTEQIARRAVRRRDMVSRSRGVYEIAEEAKLQGLQHAPSVQELQREQNKLANIFRDWLEENKIPYLGTKADILPMILEYVETYFGTLLVQFQGTSSDRRLPSAEPEDNTRLTAAFIAYLEDGEPEAFQYLTNIVKGSMLAASLFSFSPEVASPPSRFKSTTLVLDTRVLLRIIGYEGDLAQRTTSEYLDSARRLGARLGCFDFTLKEIRKILWSADSSARNGTLWKWKPGSIGAHFLAMDMGAADIVAAVANLEDDLEQAGVEVIASPSYGSAQHVIDESAVEDLFRTLSDNYKEDALTHDALALSAIVRMREGRAKGRLENCRAVFVTTNAFVVRASRRVQDLSSEPWFVSIFDTDLASLIWVKTPLAAPDIPRDVLVATCLSVLNPSDATWTRYVRTLESRRNSKQISEAELMLTREALEAKRLDLSIAQLEEEASVDAQVTITVAEARETVQREALEPQLKKEKSLQKIVDEAMSEKQHSEDSLTAVKKELDDERQVRPRLEAQVRGLQGQLEEVKGELDQLRAARDDNDRNAREEAERAAGRIANVCGGVIVVIFLVVVIAGSLLDLPRPMVPLVQIVAGVLAVGGGVSFFISPVKQKVRAYALDKLLARRSISRGTGSQQSDNL